MTEKGHGTALERIRAFKLEMPELSLQRLGLRTLPAELFKLDGLKVLYLFDNELSEIPEELVGLTNLEVLHLSDNRITQLPDSICRLRNLRELCLHNNRITSIPDSVGHLENLRMLCVFNNQISDLPTSLTTLPDLQEIFLSGNSSLGIPAEVHGLSPREINLGGATPANPNDILEYYFRAKATGRPLNEAKLILVGRGAVGKTSLVKKLIFNEFKLGESKTEGINIVRWEVPIEKENVRLNVWDFGGQEIMHATHQFFLTERSLYLLVLNGRDGGEDAEAEYWLKLIESFGANSPVIIVLNKIKEHAFDLNRSALINKYPNIRDIVRTDCDDNTGIEELRDAIFQRTGQLEELRVKFPAEWFDVKDRLASMKKNYLSFEQYRNLCKRNKVGKKKHQGMLARYLNQLGIVLNYSDDPRLRDTHVLNPHWVTNGIYKILNSSQLEENQGEIHLRDIAEILPEKNYPSEMCLYIFDLMKKFDLCFSFPDDDCHYLIPELLPKNEPTEAAGFNLSKCLNFQYHYPILPEGLLPRFITRTHHLSEGEPRWRSGVILKFEGARALVKADAVEKKVFISISGNKSEVRRRLLAVIRSDFERIHRDIKNLNPEEIVPLPGLPNEIIPYQDLLVMEAEGMVDFPKVVGSKVISFEIHDLLGGIDLPKPKETDEMKRLSLFYSYAHKDEIFKMELETHLKILQRQGVIQGWSDREIGAGEEWRKEIMEKLNSADIILLLVSADFIASDFCYDIEMQRAMERHEAREARIIPIIVRDCIWSNAPFSKLQALPKDGKAVNTWPDKDTAWRDVGEGIEKAAESLRKAKP